MNHKVGKVYLVGGGPGDLELMSRKAFRLVAEADCLIYDRLIDDDILQYTKKECECIYVGKANRHHTMKQEEINALLVEKAKEYDCIVRLKGGDVYVFGRGGEEGLYLREQQVPFEVVPGISSSIAGLAYAGIPITHRGVATGFHVVTAHNKQDELADIDFNAMARSEDTCVFLMGLSKLEEITQHLLNAGKSADCKVAVISNATLPQQDVVVSTLEHIVDDVEKHPLVSPALIVVGEVVGLREKLNFFEENPLFQKRILLSRVGNETSKLKEQLKQLGADVNEVQVSELIENTEALDNVDYQKVTHIVLTSRHAIEYFMNSLMKNDIDIRMLSHIRFAVVGSSTAKTLRSYGIKADLIPTRYDSEALFTLLANDVQSDSHVLIPKVNGDHHEWNALKDICQTTIVALYENKSVCTDEMKKALEQTWDIAVFTCSSAVRNTLNVSDLKVKDIVSIGNMTSATLEKYGIKQYHQSKQATYDSLVELILTL